MKTQLSQHFTLEELAITRQPDFKIINLEEARLFVPSLTRVALELLEPIRERFGILDINSGFRGKTLNAIVGGSVNSQHCLGEAADFNSRIFRTRTGQISIIRFFVKSNRPFGQLLLERGCIHISLGDKREVSEYDVATKTKKPLNLNLA